MKCGAMPRKQSVYLKLTHISAQMRANPTIFRIDKQWAFKYNQDTLRGIPRMVIGRAEGRRESGGKRR